MKENKPILLFQEDEVALGYKFDLPEKLKLNDILIKSAEYDVDDVEKKYTLVGGRPKAGSIYYLHPYKKNEYVDSTIGTENYFLNAKLDFFKRVGQLLGAKSIYTKVNITESQKREIDFNLDGGYKIVEGNITVKKEDEEKYKSSLEISDTYERQEHFNLHKNIDELKKLISEYNLNHETDLISLIESRDDRNHGNALTTRTIKSEISSEYNKLKDISVGITAPVFHISSNFKEELEIRNTLTIEINYNF